MRRGNHVYRTIVLEERAWLAHAPAVARPGVGGGREVVSSWELEDVALHAERGGTFTFRFLATEADVLDWNPSSSQKSLRVHHLQVMNSFLFLLRDAELERSHIHLDLQRVTPDDWIRPGSRGERRYGLHGWLEVNEAERYADTSRVIPLSTLNLAVERLAVVLLDRERSDLLEILDLTSEANMAQELDNSTTALVSSWAVVEYLLRSRWSGINKKSSRKFNAEDVASDLLAIGQLSPEQFDTSVEARRQRNGWLHSKRRPSWWDAQNALLLARALVAERLDFPPPSREGWHRVKPV